MTARRGCLCLALLLGAAGAARGDDGITFVSQGGSYQVAQTQAILDPVSRQLGIAIDQDSTPDAWPEIRTQTATGKAFWDVVDMPAKDCARGGQRGMIAPLDYAALPNARDLPDAYKTPWSVAYEFYSSVLAYNTDKYGNAPPHDWTDFWDVKRFPGTRALRDNPLATIEAALLADGVPPDRLYPIDLDRAFRKLEQIKPYITVWWTSGAQAAQLLADGEVDMEMAWSNRVSAVLREGAPVGFTWNQGLLQYTSLCILKVSPHGATATRFVNAAIGRQVQADLTRYTDNGPGNPRAYDLGTIPPARLRDLPNTPDNARPQALVSTEWWSSPAGDEAMRRWLTFVRH